MSKVKFLILGTARTGSNYLATLLQAHPSIMMFGELFNLDTLKEFDLHQALQHPVDYLDKKLNKASKECIGFKIFYEHLTLAYINKAIDPSETNPDLLKRFERFKKIFYEQYDPVVVEKKFRDAWDYLVTEKSFYVIHLMRRNKLDTLVSLRSAFATNTWMNWTGNNTSKVQLTLPYSECYTYFNFLEQEEQKHRTLFSSHNYTEVFYEDLAMDTMRVLTQLNSFLGLDFRPASSPLKKQVVNPLPEVIANFVELKQAFSETKWAEYFGRS